MWRKGTTTFNSGQATNVLDVADEIDVGTGILAKICLTALGLPLWGSLWAKVTRQTGVGAAQTSVPA